MADDLFDGVQILNPRELNLRKQEGNTESSIEPKEEIKEEPQTSEDNSENVLEDGLKMLSPQELRASNKGVNEDNIEETSETVSNKKVNANNVDIDIKALASVLSNKGLLELNEETSLESEEDLLGLMEQQTAEKADSMLEGWIKNLPPKAQAYLGLIEDGVDADMSVGLVESKAFVENLSAQSPSEDLESAYRLYLSNLGMSEEEISEEVEEAKDLSKLSDKALKAKPKLVAAIGKEEANAKNVIAQRARQEQEQRDEYIKTLENSIETSNELIAGMKLTPKMKEKIKDSFMIAVEEKDGVPLNQVNANRTRNPQAFDILLHYYTQLGLFNINEKGVAKPDISALRRKVTSDTTNSLLDIVTEKQSKGEVSSKTSSFIDKLSKINS
jgi:hypothetical protein